MATIIEFYVPNNFRQKIAQRSLEYGKLIEFRLGVRPPEDENTSGVNPLKLLFVRAALQISGD